MPHSTRRYEQDGWVLSIGPEPLDESTQASLPAQVRALRETLGPVTEELRDIIAQLGLASELSCVLYVRGSDRPSLHFDQDVLNWLTALGAEIDIDLYVLGEADVFPESES
jgi:hypothetical protein